MISTADLAEAFGRNLNIIQQQCDGLTHADSVLQLPFRGNCMNWVLGHIADNRNGMLLHLGLEPILTEEQCTRYGYDSEPVTCDGDDLIPLDKLLRLLQVSQDRLAPALQALSEEQLAVEVDSFMGKRQLGYFLFFLYFHDTYHTGTTEQLRQLAGKNDKVI